ncbi:MAG: hypothetical protein Q4G21_02555 [Dermabacter sp.]|nr:hypothetical protein [Dermabacter sp.]
MSDRSETPNGPDASGGRGSEGDEWIFPSEPGTLPTERLPSREDFERIRREKAHLSGDPDHYFAPRTSAQDSAPLPLPAHDASPATYARSGYTPAAAPRPAASVLPPRFRDLSGWDALRDLLVVLCFGSAAVTTFTQNPEAVPMLVPRLAAGLGFAAMVAVYVLRWAPTYRTGEAAQREPNLRLIGTVRLVGMVPAALVALGTIGYDLAASIPDLLTPLPDGPRVGLGAGVSLLLLGAIVGSERRGFEGYVPDAAHKARAGRVLGILRYAALGSFALAAVMMVGKAVSGDGLFSLVTFARSLTGLALVLLIVQPGLRRSPSWYVFLTGVAGAIVVGAAADNTLRLSYAAPVSFSTSYVWLPFVVAAFGLLISRAYVRSSALRFTRVDWIVYAARTLEFSVLMHGVSLVVSALMALAIVLGYPSRVGLPLTLAAMLLALLFALLSAFARRALDYRDASRARAHAVVAGVALTVIGFVSVLVYSLASGDAAGLTNGGLALLIGMSSALMLTVPTPVRDEHGAPDLDATFTAFRARELAPSIAQRFLPDISRATAERKAFPSPSSPA